MSQLEKCTIIDKKHISDSYFDFWLYAPGIAAGAEPGQFLNIDCGHSRILRRPICVCDVRGDDVRIIVEARGEGTKWLCAREVTDTLDVMGPLGNGVFPITENVLLLGGGAGSAPLLFAAHRCAHSDAVIGFNTAEKAILIDDFIEACDNLLVTTDDGTLGAKGTVLQSAEILVEKRNYSAIFACGPKPMLKAAHEFAVSKKLRLYISAEERMGCGIGACLVCACEKKDGGYAHVCKDGPVFESSVLF